MPAILPPDHFEAWLDCRGVSATQAVGLLAPAADGLLEIVDVSAKLNNPRNDGPELQEPVSRTLL
jgi:putative SOS response-associated peptidase YedK